MPPSATFNIDTNEAAANAANVANNSKPAPPANSAVVAPPTSGAPPPPSGHAQNPAPVPAGSESVTDAAPRPFYNDQAAVNERIPPTGVNPVGGPAQQVCSYNQGSIYYVN